MRPSVGCEYLGILIGFAMSIEYQLPVAVDDTEDG